MTQCTCEHPFCAVTHRSVRSSGPKRNGLVRTTVYLDCAFHGPQSYTVDTMPTYDENLKLIREETVQPARRIGTPRSIKRRQR